ncbi:monooxygenase [Trametes cingulata]|nr:monooxygenase [Trametes cingulata]
MSDTASSTLPVLVVGAGPAGLIAALSLVKNGIPVRVIEKSTEFHTASRGAGAHSRSLEVYHFLGVLEDIRRISMPLLPMRSYKLPGGTEPVKTWVMFEPVDPTPDRPITSESGVAIAQFLLEGIFRDHLAKYGVHPELATELVALEQDAEGVTATLKKHAGTPNETMETVRAAYLIGADGARGPTRRLIGATFEGQTKDLDGQVWVDVDIEGLPTEYWHLWSQPGKFTVSMRPTHRKGGFHVGVAGINFDPIAELTDTDKFVKFIHENIGRRDLKFTNFTSFSYWKPKMRMVNKFYSGRAFLVGDAAHVHSPTGGQGLNTSVQDSFNLAWKIALVYKGLARPELIASYEAERLPVVTIMLSTTTGLYSNLVASKDGKSEDGWLQWRNRSLTQLDINYRWSPIVLDARGNGDDEDALKARAYVGYPGEEPHAGDRAPGAPALVGAAGKVTSLHEIYKPHLHTIIVFSPETEDAESRISSVSQAIDALPKDTYQVVVLGRNGVPKAPGAGVATYHDKEGYAFGAYHVQEDKLTVVAIRPDAYIGAFVYDGEGLNAYFSRLGMAGNLGST